MIEDTKYENLYRGISKIAWGYVFILFDINLGTVSILPQFVGFLLVLSGIGILQEEEGELALLRPFGISLVIWHGADWIFSWFAGSVENLLPILNIIICVISIYFYFQLWTNLASIAGKYQPEGDLLDGKFLTYRTVQTVLMTGTMFLTYLSSWLGDAGNYLALGMIVVSLIVGVLILMALFRLRSYFKN